MKLARVASVGTIVILIAALAAGGMLYVMKEQLLAFAKAPFKGAAATAITVVIPKGANLQPGTVIAP